MNLLIALIVGAVSGYIASRILGGDGFGLLGNIVVGVIGGIIGDWIIREAKISMMSGIFGTFISSVGGAIVLLFLLGFLKTYTSGGKSARRR
ncbi:MAG TPA: GlsB/YeaQ/YmgE family stress response membrane protein [Saprospiraceae bacterium]|jgi:uncharacterized membrane protein YeaQ/YmgE (transglycosylase-associated protein family)|nr:GlsB/YeaQ/YmgE family stress response membrane protein [Saprospiraceae bacterium]HRO08020.1 GlsB/YeaQ/YmgE family stress response membrane protein [Saprospiraceae bacterium]HRO72751.1 GlsB/YeaQ/YmgE family stress response membrane protein [Saprospiraceae bacterium]HRP41393.1 GlsB/YeaQ/YmgE family stress response membrane protein [Saprospiraceae bacterium]